MIRRARRTIARCDSGFLGFTGGFAAAFAVGFAVAFTSGFAACFTSGFTSGFAADVTACFAAGSVAVFRALLSAMHEGYAERRTARDRSRT
ncbi:hypothetical protein GCM10010502_13950 [Kitasatospora aureofaciens]|uniref:Uncharacterized protein n=1 Tax=Kitasatospora aureofaciens TaxID=1894 RepID=A0A8H9LJV8_KITAU|nr:hypothetical protein GCM10010502_13950 [Kitasatospora aureofaciens]